MTGPATVPGLVIFDCDGVLVDSEPLAMRVLLKVLAEAGLALDPTVGYDRFLGRSLAATVETVREEFGVTLDAGTLAEMRRNLHAAFRDELRATRGVEDLLACLPCPYCVASSSQPERIELALRIVGLWPAFEGRVFSASSVDHGKPAPDLFLLAAREMGVPAERCLVVEDSPVGIRAAQAAGMRVIAYSGGGHADAGGYPARVAALNPEAVIYDLRHLMPILGVARSQA